MFSKAVHIQSPWMISKAISKSKNTMLRSDLCSTLCLTKMRILLMWPVQDDPGRKAACSASIVEYRSCFRPVFLNVGRRVFINLQKETIVSIIFFCTLIFRGLAIKGQSQQFLQNGKF